jgi:hypothetical protein
MITGYNTDVRHHDVVLHVQTEDKGAGNPLIESLVYVGGQVLAARRASYSSLLTDERSEKVDKAIQSLMDRQHRTLIAAIRGGRFDSKLAQLLGGARAPAAITPPPGSPLAPAAKPPGSAAAAGAARVAESEGPPAAGDRTLDQVILEYLTSEAEQEHLQLALDESSSLPLGERAYLVLHARSSKSGEGVKGVQVTVKMISTVDSPQNLAYGTTDERGAVRLVFDIPILGRGTAALIISASSGIGRAEIKQLL